MSIFLINGIHVACLLCKQVKDCTIMIYALLLQCLGAMLLSYANGEPHLSYANFVLLVAMHVWTLYFTDLDLLPHGPCVRCAHFNCCYRCFACSVVPLSNSGEETLLDGILKADYL